MPDIFVANPTFSPMSRIAAAMSPLLKQSAARAGLVRPFEISPLLTRLLLP
jgi:hypothetical protein